MFVISHFVAIRWSVQIATIQLCHVLYVHSEDICIVDAVHFMCCIAGLYLIDRNSLRTWMLSTAVAAHWNYQLNHFVHFMSVFAHEALKSVVSNKFHLFNWITWLQHHVNSCIMRNRFLSFALWSLFYCNNCNNLHWINLVSIWIARHLQMRTLFIDWTSYPFCCICSFSNRSFCIWNDIKHKPLQINCEFPFWKWWKLFQWWMEPIH